MTTTTQKVSPTFARVLARDSRFIQGVLACPDLQSGQQCIRYFMQGSTMDYFVDAMRDRAAADLARDCLLMATALAFICGTNFEDAIYWLADGLGLVLPWVRGPEPSGER